MKVFLYRLPSFQRSTVQGRDVKASSHPEQKRQEQAAAYIHLLLPTAVPAAMLSAIESICSCRSTDRD